MLSNTEPRGFDDLFQKVIRSQLVQAQALGILLSDVRREIATLPEGADIGAVLEDIGNAYLDLAEDIAALRAETAPTNGG